MALAEQLGRYCIIIQVGCVCTNPLGHHFPDRADLSLDRITHDWVTQICKFVPHKNRS